MAGSGMNALTALGISVEKLTQDESEYLTRRKGELEAMESGEPVLVREVLLAEFNIARFQKRQQELNDATDANPGELEFRQQQLKALDKQLDGYMDRYNRAMDGLGARVVKKGAGKQASPLSELWLRYRRLIAQKDKRGEKVGSPSDEALELAAKKAESTGLVMDYTVKGALPDDVRQKAIEEVRLPSVDEKKKLEQPRRDA